MEDGSIKHIEELQLGDRVKDGGLVDGLGSFLADDIYDYQGIYVAGSHAVKEDGTPFFIHPEATFGKNEVILGVANGYTQQ